MKRIMPLVIILGLSSISLSVLGQSDEPTKLEITFGGGLSLPVGSFAKKNPNASTILDKNVSFTRILGFSKNKNGFANQGYNYNLELKYKLNSFLKIVLSIGTTTNSVATSGMSELLTEVDRQEVKVEENSYRFFYINPGIGYFYELNKFEFGLNIFVGYSAANFPYYKFLFVSYPPLMFAHDGPIPKLSALNLGSSFSTIYKLSNHFRIGIDVSYQRTNFSYNMTPRLIPGGDGSGMAFSDILKSRLINTGFKIGYSF